MARIVLSLDSTILGEYQLDKPRTTIGRRSVSDIHIDHLAVSGEHAVILKVGSEYYLEDSGSTNGTRVNGLVVKKHLLQPDDFIELGRYHLKFLSVLSAVHDKSHFVVANTEDVSSSAPSDRVASVAAMTNQSQANAIAKIKVLNGANAGRELTINKALTTLGKVGSQVAVINKRPDGYFISHIEGTVFPSVNGVSIGSQGYALNAQDVIELAGVKMEFYFPE